MKRRGRTAERERENCSLAALSVVPRDALSRRGKARAYSSPSELYYGCGSYISTRAARGDSISLGEILSSSGIEYSNTSERLFWDLSR